VRFRATIYVRPKAEIRDPQGEAVLTALRALGHEVEEVRTGKEILVTFAADDEDAARAVAERMGDQLLANPVIEDYEIAVKEAGATAASPPARVR
jgi:phosphoribosylformylglycinamidine synthase